MSELTSYGLQDFLLFSPEVYWRLFVLHNQTFWYLVPVCIAASAALCALPMLGRKRAALLVATGAAALCGWSYFLESYATINWAAPWIALGWGALALALAIAVCRDTALAPPPLRRAMGSALLVYGCLIYPMQGLAFGRPLDAAQLVGLTPAPTALATLGLLALTHGCPAVRIAGALAAALCVIEGLTLHALGSAEAWALFAGAAVGLVSLPWRTPART